MTNYRDRKLGGLKPEPQTRNLIHWHCQGWHPLRRYPGRRNIAFKLRPNGLTLLPASWHEIIARELRSMDNETQQLHDTKSRRK